MKSKPAPPEKSAMAERLREFRKRHGLSQSKAASLCLTPTRTWQGWEAEQREPPGCLAALLNLIDLVGMEHAMRVITGGSQAPPRG